MADRGLRSADPQCAFRIPHYCLFLTLLVASACNRPMDRGVGRPGSLRGANILLITIDTLRQDRLGAYGNRSGLTPNLDRLAAAGVRYAHAFTPVPLTLPAHASILTGLLPRHHGIHNNTSVRLDDRVPTLATVAKQAGYRTGAFVGAFVLDGRFGLNRGFDEYDDRLPHGDRATFHYAERRAEEVVTRAYEWIANPQPAQSGQSAIRPSGASGRPEPVEGRTPPSAMATPWFAWVHLFDPHAPYDAPAEFRAGRAPYDAEVAYTDAMIGRLLARLDAAHALARTLIVVAADHGESLGEHGETTHGLFAYNATLSVPLIISGPSIEPGTVDSPVSHVDVAPTILELVGLETPGILDGRSLARPPSPDRPLFFEALDASLSRGWAPLRGVIQGGFKYIDLPDAELYDLTSDPGEQRNRIDRDPHAETLKRTLSALSSGDAVAPGVALDADAAGRLRSLGYAAGASARKPVTSADDPKRLVALSERFNSALTAFDDGRPGDALTAFLAILGERPDFAAARASASTILVAEGHADKAIELLRAGLQDQPDSPELLAKLGTARRAAGDLRGAAGALERARQAGNDSADVVNDLAVVYAGLGRTDDARALFRQAVARSPGSATSWFNLGLFELQTRNPNEAAADFRRATEIEPSYGEAWQALGAALVTIDRAQAVEAWRRAERLVPGDYDLLFNLSMTLAESAAPGDAIPYLRRFVREAPPDRYARDIVRVRATLARLERQTP